MGGTRPDPGTSGNTRDHSDSQSRQTSLGGDLKLLYQNCTLGRWGENFTGQHELGLSEPDRGFGQNLECFLVIGFSDTFLFKCLTTTTTTTPHQSEVIAAKELQKAPQRVGVRV